MDYLDFEVEIAPGAGGHYSVAVLRSPAGEATESVRFALDSLALENRLQALQIALLRSGGTWRRIDSAEAQAVQQFGEELWSSLFVGGVLGRLEASRNVARQREMGLRVKLRTSAPELAALPWEYLYDPHRADYLALSAATPLVRYIPLPQAMEPLAVRLPLRILAMVVATDDLAELDVERERARLERAVEPLRERGVVELVWLQGRTWRDLQQALRRESWHIFHFVGHGGFDPVHREGLIVLADERGRSHRLSATDLGRLLGDHEPLRLAVLNSCDSARTDRIDVFSSTATTLVRRGTPAVVAMQYEITDDAAIEFSRSFYEALADGLPVDAALGEARKGIALAIPNTLEWGTPVLHMRAPDGVLFKLSGRRSRRPVADAVAPAATPVPAAAATPVPAAAAVDASPVPPIAAAAPVPADPPPAAPVEVATPAVDAASAEPLSPVVPATAPAVASPGPEPAPTATPTSPTGFTWTLPPDGRAIAIRAAARGFVAGFGTVWLSAALFVVVNEVTDAGELAGKAGPVLVASWQVGLAVAAILAIADVVVPALRAPRPRTRRLGISALQGAVFGAVVLPVLVAILGLEWFIDPLQWADVTTGALVGGLGFVIAEMLAGRPAPSGPAPG